MARGTEAGTRERIVNATAELFRRQGFHGTGMKQIAEHAGAPFGSIYHFFPGGKDELGAEVIGTAGRFFARVVADAMEPAPDAACAVRYAFDGAARTLRDTDYADACPIATVALEVASTNERLREATAEAFEGWLAGLTARFEQEGIEQPEAGRLAVCFLASLEGAFILSRATRSTTPLEQAGATVAAAVDGGASRRAARRRKGTRARMNQPSLTGGCLCGGVRFELTEPATAAYYCHCTRCQRRTGTASSAQARIDDRTFRLLKGEELVKAWRHPDGGFEKYFCRECGAHLFSRNPDDPRQMSVRLSAFDGDPGVRPSWRTYVAYAAPWEPVPDDGLEHYDEGRPRF